MDPKWMKLAGCFLEQAAEIFSNHGCSDWRWPEDWSADDRREMATLMVLENVHAASPSELTEGDREDVDRFCDGIYGPPNWWVMQFLTRRLRGAS